MSSELQDKLNNITTAADQPAAPEAPKRGRGRPPKDPNKKKAAPMVQPIPTPTPDPVIASIVKIPFDVWGNSQGLEQLKLKDEEALQISAPLKALADYYLPQMNPIAGVWFSLGLTISNVMMSRLVIVAKARKEKKKDDGQKNNGDNGNEGKRKVNARKTPNPTTK